MFEGVCEIRYGGEWGKMRYLRERIIVSINEVYSFFDFYFGEKLI